ncbi:hypothetical protein KR009_006506, partial [Drosophila setifemur]
TQHIPWNLRTRRQKVIIVIFYILTLFILVNVAGWLAFLTVYMNDRKYYSRMARTTNDPGVTATNSSLT